VDWEWLGHHPAAQQLQTVRHVRLERPLHIVMNGKTNRGVILKPGRDTNGQGSTANDQRSTISDPPPDT